MIGADPILFKLLAAEIRIFCAASKRDLDGWFCSWVRPVPVGGCVCRASRPWASARSPGTGVRSILSMVEGSRYVPRNANLAFSPPGGRAGAMFVLLVALAGVIAVWEC